MIDTFITEYPAYFPYLPSRILNNCFLLPIEADQQDTALRIFSTLNNRGKALSDADIFKAEFYKYYSKEGRKDEFMETLQKFCLVFTIIGAIVWGLIGFFDFNLVTALFGDTNNIISRIIYSIIAIAGIINIGLFFED